MQELEQKIFNVRNETFEAVALEVFRYQYENVAVYRNYVDVLGKNVAEIQSLSAIPFLPISFFKTHQVVGNKQEAQLVFESSGTTGMLSSKHYVTRPAIYEKSLLNGFEKAFGDPKQYCFVALLPNYLLVYMVNHLMSESKHPKNGFYLYNHEELYATLQELEAQKQPTLLFGVSFALLDFAEKYALSLRTTKVIETGGMKGRRKEITRAELHQTLCQAFGTSGIYSEYGMTELLSQGYSQKQDEYHCPPWLRVVLREVNDPFSYVKQGEKGGINIIDLANLYSCSFIETQDLGCINSNGSFSVLGRFDTSDVRGCNLMVAE